MPSVSVVMPVHNGGRFLRESIGSILGQTFTDWELLVIDDASGDDSADIVRSFPDPRVRLERLNERVGAAVARNRGIARAEGRYIVLMDCDDMCDPRRVELQVRFLEQNPRVAAVGTAFDELREADGAPRARRWDVPADPALVRWGLFFEMCVCHPSYAFLRDALNRLGGYDTRYDVAEDYDLFLRLTERRWIANLAEPLYRWRRHDAQLTSKRELCTRSADDVTSRAVGRVVGREVSIATIRRFQNIRLSIPCDEIPRVGRLIYLLARDCSTGPYAHALGAEEVRRRAAWMLDALGEQLQARAVPVPWLLTFWRMRLQPRETAYLLWGGRRAKAQLR